MRRRTGLLLALLLVAAQLASSPAAASTAPLAQYRAYFVDAFGDGLYTDAQIDSVIAATKAANLNAIVAQVVKRGDCLCNSSMLPRNADLTVPAPFDPLASLVAKAHAQGIAVDAWIITTDIWKGTTPPADPNHVFNTHGPSTTGRANWIDLRSDGADHLGDEWFIDPGHPDAAQWMVDVAKSVVTNYGVDGINLDRIRYPDGNLATNVPSWGYNATALARFQAATGRTDRPAPTDAQWTQWRRDQVTGIVRKIYLETYAIRSGVRISVDGIAYGSGPSAQGGWQNTRTYAEVLQDWVGWAREGIVDLVIPMNYKRDTVSNEQLWFSQWADFAKVSQSNRAMAMGTALYLNTIDASVRQIRTSLAPSSIGSYGAGWVGYSYRSPDTLAVAGTRTADASRAELTRALTQPSGYDPITPPVFANPAPVPPMTWKTAPTKSQLRGTALAAGAPLADARVDLYDDASGAYVATRTTDGNGWFGFVDLAPSRYRAQTSGGSAIATVVAGQVANVSIAAGPCTSSVGPGIPPPARLPSGIGGFHAAWYGQSGYPTLCAGQRSTAVVAYYNSGSFGWVAGVMGQVAYLGTWDPVPGQDQPSTLGGDGTNGSPATGWPRDNRVALQPHPYVGPGQVSWFQFTIQAPSAPGTYRLYIRPLVEGATWMEDYGVYWLVTVR